MKMSKQEFRYLKEAINKVLDKKSKSVIIEEYETGQFPRSDRVKNLQQRFIWDCFWATGIKLRHLADIHINTALLKICPQVTRRY